MTKYGFLIYSDTGIPVYNSGFAEEAIPPSNLLPNNSEIVTFDETTPHFELLHAFFFGDPNRLTIEYKAAVDGGVIYDTATKTFSFHKQDFSIKLDEVKIVRNQLLAATDKYMLIPDLPQTIKDDVLAYRATLRDITTKVGTEWHTVFDVQWPEFPSKLIMKPVIPPQV
jgi:hypothetical protein